MPASTALAAAAATATLGAAAYYLYKRYINLPPHALKAKLAAFAASTDVDGKAWLDILSTAASLPLDSPAFAGAVDTAAPSLRAEFHVPPHGALGDEQAYMAGNSLGLMPKSSSSLVQGVLSNWKRLGVGGHFEGELAWAKCEDTLPPLFAELVGAKDAALEIGAMNSLTVNLHLLMAAFYKPSKGRAAILIEADAFPSDRYAVGSQIRHHGFAVEDEMIEVQPRSSDSLLHTADILGAIDKNAHRLALVLLGGVNYLTGQVLDMPAISAHMYSLNQARKAKGQPPILYGLDLAHAVGNVPLALHDWKVDFAAWCSYKYLNSGAGCLSALFVHSDHAYDDAFFPRLAGWWGVPLKTRFIMAHGYECAAGAPAFGVSNVNPLMVACVLASLRLFEKAGGVSKLRRRSLLLTAYLEALLASRGLLVSASAPSSTKKALKATLRLLTPSDPSRRGCQLSLKVTPVAEHSGPPLTMKALEKALHEKGVVVDSREPDVIRAAPTPLYNSFGDVRKVVDALEACLAA